MSNEHDNKLDAAIQDVKSDEVDENMSLFIYGNLKIRDVQTGEILVNQRF